MSYRIMRMLLMFDLPINNKKDIRIYSKFRKELISKGFVMIQYSVYMKILANRDACDHTLNFINKISPDRGRIRVLTLTEKQYQSMVVVIGGKSNVEDLVTKEVMLVI